MPAELSLGAVETNLLTIAIDKLVNTPAMKVTTSQKNATIPKGLSKLLIENIFSIYLRNYHSVGTRWFIP